MVLMIAAATGLVTCTTVCADEYWQVQTGNWSVGPNWSGNLLPVGTDTAWIVNGGTATVTTNVGCGTLQVGGSGGGTVLVLGGSIGELCQHRGRRAGGVHTVGRHK